MKREDLRKISSMEELDAARRVIAKNLRGCRHAMENDVRRVQGMFRPMSLLGAGWGLLVPNARPLDRILLGWVRSMKKFVQKIP